MKLIRLVIVILASAVFAVVAQESNTSTNTVDESAPLGDKLSKRTVWVRNRDGKPIENATVIVDYSSDPKPPRFKTDGQGKAEVMVQRGFWGLRVDLGDVRVTINGSIEWPCEIRVPTTKTKI